MSTPRRATIGTVLLLIVGLFGVAFPAVASDTTVAAPEPGADPTAAVPELAADTSDRDEKLRTVERMKRDLADFAEEKIDIRRQIAELEQRLDAIRREKSDLWGQFEDYSPEDRSLKIQKASAEKDEQIKRVEDDVKRAEERQNEYDDDTRRVSGELRVAEAELRKAESELRKAARPKPVAPVVGTLEKGFNGEIRTSVTGPASTPVVAPTGTGSGSDESDEVRSARAKQRQELTDERTELQTRQQQIATKVRELTREISGLWAKYEATAGDRQRKVNAAKAELRAKQTALERESIDIRLRLDDIAKELRSGRN